MFKHPLSIILGSVVLCAAGLSSAATITVLPGDANWVSPPSANTGGGSSTINSTAPRSGNGSVELHGDRTRLFGLGNPFSPGSNLGLLSSVSGFKFDWMVATAGGGNPATYSPALRLHIWDGEQRSELIWENAYNGPTPIALGTWYTTGNTDNFWRFQTGPGDSLVYNRSISQWSTNGYSANAYISAISVGAGSSAGAGYVASVDNVTINFGTAGSTTFNFEAAPTGRVPDSGSTLTLLGCAMAGLAGFARKSRK